MKIYVVRHGETENNRKGILQGWLDASINDNGILLAELTGKALKDVAFDVVFCSPLKRAKETAEILLKENKVTSLTADDMIFDERIKEISFGDWEGMVVRGENVNIPEMEYEFFLKDAYNFVGGPNGESIQHLLDRTGDFYNDIISRPELADKTILVSTHGCALRALLNQVYVDKTDYWHGKVPENCAVNIIEVEDGKGKLVGDDLTFYDKGLCVNIFNNG